MTVAALSYTDGAIEEFEDLEAARGAPGTTWVRARNAPPAELQRVADAFDIHPLSVEDVRSGVRPKVEEFDGYTFMLATAASLRRGDTTFAEELRDEPVGIFFGTDWLVTLSTSELAAVGKVWDAILRGESRLLARGPDFAASRVLDGIVDEYFTILEEIEGDIERVEDAVIDAPDEDTLEHINSIRRELLSVRRLLWPTRDATSGLARGDPVHVQEATEKYYRDVYDHLIQLVELVETYRDLAAGARDMYLNALSMSTNEVMKRLTVVATIVLPLTLVVGVFGMNFADGPYNMPELGWQYGYPAVMFGMLGIAVVMLAHFRREGWL